MKALALLEFASITRGILATDRMLKSAPIALLSCGTVHPGRYLILVGGTVASTDTAYREGIATGATTDAVILPDPHPLLQEAIGSEPAKRDPDTDLLALETATSPELLRQVDRLLKAHPLTVTELRLADDLGGRAIALLQGELADVQQAGQDVQAAEVAGTGVTVIGRPDAELSAALTATTRFGACGLRSLPGGEALDE
jgi:microcompartment protein CcmL/EutN